MATIYRAQAVYAERNSTNVGGPGNEPFEWVIGTLSKRAARDQGRRVWLEVKGGDRLVWESTLAVLIPGDDTATPKVTVRARVLDEAKRITATDRNTTYGEPEDNFQRIADFWNTFLGPKLKDGSKITPGDTAALMIMVKLAREMNAPKEDNKVDGAGYFACWAEVDARG